MESVKLRALFLRGNVSVPASKSVAQRAVAAATLADGVSILKNVSFSDDVKSALRVAEILGAKIETSGNEVQIAANFGLNAKVLHLGESGLATRMFLPIAGLTGKPFYVSGEGSLLSRKMNFLVETLRPLGLVVDAEDGLLPFRVIGSLKAGNFKIDASESSQLLTGLLMAYPMLQETTRLQVVNLKSKPYIDLTLEAMSRFGVNVQHENYEIFTIEPQKYQPAINELEGDWSGAAFWFVAAALEGDLVISGLNPHSKQADKAILEVLQMAGASVGEEAGKYHVQKSRLKAFVFDATDCPDLFPPLAALAVGCVGISRIRGVHRLKNKESDRAKVLTTELSKMGVKIFVEGDDLVIEGTKAIRATFFDSYNDHRMAMTGAILNLLADGETEIGNYTCVNKSYPSFFDDFLSLVK